MSDTANAPDTEDRREAPRRQAPLLPEAGAAGMPLTIVVAVLAFMASVALAGYFMVSRAAEDWSGDLSGTITVQVKGATPAIIDERSDEAIRILEATAGVLSIDRISREESEALLEPWLGRDNLSAEIPIPTLISGEVSPTLRRDLTPLRTALEEGVEGASLDDHGLWNDRLVAAAGRAQTLAFIIFLMILMATISVIIFAARAGLAANRSIVEVMHLVGATDDFIARHVQRRYFSLGLRGGIAGAGLAVVVLLILARAGGDGEGFFLPNLQADPAMLGWLTVVPLLLCGTASLAARLTVRRILANEIH